MHAAALKEDSWTFLLLRIVVMSQEGVRTYNEEVFRILADCIGFENNNKACFQLSLKPEHLRSIVTTTDKAHLEPNLPLACGPRRMNGSFFTFPSKSWYYNQQLLGQALNLRLPLAIKWGCSLLPLPPLKKQLLWLQPQSNMSYIKYQVFPRLMTRNCYTQFGTSSVNNVVLYDYWK